MPAHAALYQFTLGGRITGGFPQLLNLNIGDPCTIQYVLDSRDLNPDPLLGVYLGTRPTIVFPNGVVSGYPQTTGSLTVVPGPQQPDIVYYQNYPGSPLDPSHYGVQISFMFPDQTLTSDALPLELPLPQAFVSYFDLYPSFDPILVGTITSYASAEVPEPRAACLCLLITSTRAPCRRAAGRRNPGKSGSPFSDGKGSSDDDDDDDDDLITGL